MKQFFLACFLTVLLTSCGKESGEDIRKLSYVLELPDQHKVELTYYSDYFYDSKELKEFEVEDTVSNPDEKKQWVGTRFVEETDSLYFIRVSVQSMTVFEGEKLLRVVANDSTTIDSVFYRYGDLYFQLEGVLPDKI